MDNFFIPTLKLKERIKNHRGKTIKKIYESAKTPYQSSGKQGCNIEKEELKTIISSLNMVRLKEEIDELIKILYES